MAVIIVRPVTDRVSAVFREAPSTIPALAAAALLVAWATDQGGYPVTHWAPGGLVLLTLLGITAGVLGVRSREVPRPVKVAVGALAAYTGLSFLSIAWAGSPADAWDGANRTLLYLLAFTLFAWWPHTGRSALVILGGWILALTGVALFVLAHVDAARIGELRQLLPEGRLVYPSSYANANAAQWLMAFWPALLLTRSPRLPWALRGVLAGAAVLLAEAALLSQSRGSLYATPVMLLLVFALFPARTRTFVSLVPVAGGIAAAAPAVLHVGDHLRNGVVVPATLHHAVAVILVVSAVVALVVGAAAWLETRLTVTADVAGRAHRLLGAAAVATLIAALAAGWVAAGNPLARVEHAWDTFKSPRGYAANSGGSRLTSGLGSQRYDFYRVALDEFAAHPLAGIGADNFQQSYLRHRRSSETPRYPHSVELRTLAQSGLAGTALALLGLVAALLASIRAAGMFGATAADRALGRPVVAAAALGGFAYWLIHGSFDWFFEFAGLGAPAFALLGLSVALYPRRPRETEQTDPAVAEPRTGAAPGTDARRRRRRLVACSALALFAGLAAAASFVGPWLGGLQVESAVRVWRTAPLVAYSRLSDAARLDPLSDEGYVVAGSIALRLGDLERADREFSRALERVPKDAYATLELGAIASARGRNRDAVVLLRRAVGLNPRDRLAAAALRVALSGRRLDVGELNNIILLDARQLL
jgi:tetratricopeptide (TPR) repeat protein